MKIILSNSKEYQVSIVTQITETQLCIGFTGVTKYDDLRADLTASSLQVVKFYPSELMGSFKVIEDYVTFEKAVTTETEAGTLDVAVYLQKADKVTKAINDLKQEIVTLKETNQYLQETVDTLVLENLEG